jgi:hypothetical protein
MLDTPLDGWGRDERSALFPLRSEVGIHYTFDYKTFRGIGECTADERRQVYESELQSVAARSRGMVTITNVRVVEDEPDCWFLEFDCNGVTESWPDPGDDENMAVSMAFADCLPDLTTGTIERFCFVDPRSGTYLGEVVFGEPEALNRLGEHFGITFNPTY